MVNYLIVILKQKKQLEKENSMVKTVVKRKNQKACSVEIIEEKKEVGNRSNAVAGKLGTSCMYHDAFLPAALTELAATALLYDPTYGCTGLLYRLYLCYRLLELFSPEPLAQSPANLKACNF